MTFQRTRHSGFADLLAILPDDISMENYCGQQGAWAKWENEIATPALQALGYTNIRWHMGERDSFGPLSRVVLCDDSNGIRHKFIYG